MAKKRKIPDPRSDELVANIRREMNLPRLAQSVRSSGRVGKMAVAKEADNALSDKRR
jgi:hypothetical protein